MDSAIKASKKTNKAFRHHVFKGSKKVSNGAVKGFNKVRKVVGLRNMKKVGKAFKRLPKAVEKLWHKAF